MTRYFRPLGILSGAAARAAIEQKQALPLADGSLAFALVEIIDRDGDRAVTRRIEPAFPPCDVPAPIAKSGPSIAVMGIVNATPDSFSDGGAFLDPAAAVAHGKSMIAAGAKIVDIGGESTRPGAAAIDPAEEIRRVLPVIAGLREAAQSAGVAISIDTRNAATMRAALDAGATMLNDVSALTHDPQSLAVAAGSTASIVLMHKLGEPGSMQDAPRYADVVLDVYDYLQARIAACVAAGIDRSRLIADPGIGFGKTTEHNLALLDQLSVFHGLGVKLLVGVSRKRFLARLSAAEPADGRLAASLAAGLAAVGQGAQILRVHDVAETVQALKIAGALQSV
jgi:dihydropteroate synthase